MVSQRKSGGRLDLPLAGLARNPGSYPWQIDFDLKIAYVAVMILIWEVLSAVISFVA
jgi:hypothetical protein